MSTTAPGDGRSAQVTTRQVWRALEKASFAVLSHVTPGGEPRSSGVVYGAAERTLYVVVAAGSWKARQIADGDVVAVTVPIHRGGPLALVVPIPPATVSFRTRATVHPPGSLGIESVSPALARLLPRDRQDAVVLELQPFGSFLTYGIGVGLRDMAKPEAARARIPVGP